MISRLVLVSGLLLSGVTVAQEELMEVMVTGSRVSGPGSTPAVTVAKTADFLVQNIRLINDSRTPSQRRQEIVQSIESLMRQADRNRDIDLSYGQGFLLPINLNDEALELIDDDEREDTGYVDIYVKVRFDPRRDAREQIDVLRRFITGASKVGRTEIDSLGEIGLSIVSPEKYRYEIIQAVAAETRKLREAVGQGCKVSLSGLESRVQWQRSSVSQLTLFIPYQVQVADCTG
jgi:hypothetical protein